MRTDFYLPILKSKDGEFTALSKLNEHTKSHMCPLFEISDNEFDNQSRKKPKTLEEHLYNFCHKKFAKKWARDNSFIDTGLLRDKEINGLTCIEYVYKQLASQVLIPMKPVPVAHLNETIDSLSGLKNILSAHGISELAIRIQIADLYDPELELKLGELLTSLSMDVANTHLIFDLADSDFTEYEDFADGIMAQLEYFPQFKLWKSFSLCGGAFPKTNILQKGVNSIARTDWKLYKLVAERLSVVEFGRKINYGDYSIVAPGHFEFDPTKMSRSANIRYTLDDIWFVIKGSALKTTEDFKQYFSQAEDIYTADFYAGENFSQGDMHLKHCYLRLIKAGSPTVWTWVGNNHHFTKVVGDLFSNPAYA
jgi:hypothetical protein